VSQIVRNRTSERQMTSSIPDSATVTIERVVAGGFGLARHGGRVLLIPLTAPGDVVEIELPTRSPRARLIRVVIPGPDRVEPACAHYGECGGCDLMHVSYPAQVQAKVAMVVETIERIGGRGLLASVSDVPIKANPLPLGSRIRATWQPTRCGRAGYFRRGSHEVIEIDDCPILDPSLEAQRKLIGIGTRTTALTNGRCISISVSAQTADMVEFTVADEIICGSADAFFQANLALLDQFVRHVVQLGARGSPKRVLELYSGIALFTVPLARLVGEIDAVESSELAVELARKNVERASLRNVNCYAESAERWLGIHLRSEYRPDTLLVDPPRAGLSNRVIAGILSRSPGQIVYVSCDPATFARDAHRIVGDGYRITDVTVFDLFPQTHHVELVAAFQHQ
jgi:23S rRNA (uracil1939-C5)-methyltransferase